MEKAKMFGWQVPKVDWSITRPSFVRFPFIVDNRNEWLELLQQTGIQAGTWLNHPIHPEGSDYEVCGYRQGMCPVAEHVAERIVNVPVHSRTGGWMIESIEKVFQATRQQTGRSAPQPAMN
jgi:dTDP-4-amino-4,6-dideoxygalactose transaminase